MKPPWLYVVLLPMLFPANTFGQDCNIISKANDINPDQLCSPVQVITWEVSYVGVNHAGTPVNIYIDWDDGVTETIPATELDAARSEWGAIASHTYVSNDDICNHRPVASLVVNGTICTSSSQEQIVTIWDNDNTNGGRVRAAPNVYPICVGNQAVVQFADDTEFNCVPPQEEDVPNDRTRWIQWVYGTSNSMTGLPVLVDGLPRTFPFEGPVIILPGPVTGSDELSLPITVADDKLIGQEFEVELRYWNYCNPYPGSDPVTDRSVIRIVDDPDATISPVDTLCEFQSNIFLVAVTGGGTWSGPGIVHPSTGEFSPSTAGTGAHTIRYQITDNNGCSSEDTEVIVVRPGPEATILPAGPFCSYDAPYDLEASLVAGSWSGPGITNSTSGIFDPVMSGPGEHFISFESVPDANGCVGADTAVLLVMDSPLAQFLTPDSSWCQSANNGSSGELLISGNESSTFDLVVNVRGSNDTLKNLTTGNHYIQLDNQTGENNYALLKIIERYGNLTCEAELSDILVMEVHPAPVMELQVHYDDPCSPVEVEFEAVEGYRSYSWDFGDGYLHITPYPRVSYTYRYDLLGIEDADTIYAEMKTDTVFQIRLGIVSDFGCTDSMVESIRIYPSPLADFIVSPPSQYYPDTEIQLINQSTPGNWSYHWDFGDGNTSLLKDPEHHIYDNWGIFNVGLSTYSPYCRDSISKEIRIIPPPPQAIFQPDTAGCPPLDITFRNESKYADSYHWDFDDGTFSTEASPTHRFTQSKEHRVILTAIGLAGTDTAEQIILVYPQPRAEFDAYPREARNLNQLIKFINTSTHALTYRWDFGDGAASEEENPSHTYDTPGSFSVTLQVWSNEGCPDIQVKENLISVLEGEGNTIFPNAFKWNETGPTGGHWDENTIDNTVFHPRLENAAQLHMIIYTRWGEMIWETKEVHVGWDGYLKSGELVPPGVYVYKALVTYSDGRQEIIAGDITFLH